MKQTHSISVLGLIRSQNSISIGLFIIKIRSVICGPSLDHLIKHRCILSIYSYIFKQRPMTNDFIMQSTKSRRPNRQRPCQIQRINLSPVSGFHSNQGPGNQCRLYLVCGDLSRVPL